MKKLLQEKDTTILKTKFLSINGVKDLATVLEVKTGHLYYWIKKQSLKEKYKLFKIPKKNGGERIIIAPKPSFKILLRKLNNIISLFYSTKPPVNGFVKNRSIITNAETHLNKRLVLNIDLEDFFPTINKGRVYGIFKQKPFSFPPHVASLLADICCVNNSLPQGAPTSPILSNFACRKLDNELTKLAKEFKCTYSRYADDITFSTNMKSFPKELIEFIRDDNNEIVIFIGDSLRHIIYSNGFKINHSKVRINSKNNRQSVTGLIVNDRINLPRTYIKNVKSMLFNWEINIKKGKELGLSAKEILSNAEKYHYSKNVNKKYYYKKKSTFLNILRGKLNYIRNVRGDYDYVYAKLINKYNELIGNGKDKLPTNQIEEINKNVLVLETIHEDDSKLENENYSQGTAFLMQGIGFVTCYHCIYDANDNVRENLRAFYTHTTSDNDKFKISVIKSDKTLDIAIIKIEGLDIDYTKNGFIKGDASKITYRHKLEMVGFPDYFPGQSPDIKNFVVTKKIRKHGIDMICVDKPIIKGHSGGPVFNYKNEIIGVATRGSAAQHANDTSNFLVTAINAIEYL